MEFKVGDRVMCSVDNPVCDKFDNGEVETAGTRPSIIFNKVMVGWGPWCVAEEYLKPLIRRTWTTTQADIDCRGRY